jgi:hypothetical protein
MVFPESILVSRLVANKQRVDSTLDIVRYIVVCKY